MSTFKNWKFSYLKKEPTETESNMGQADVKKELSVTEEIVAQSINWVSDARQKNSLNGLNWVSNSDRGQVLLQMMEVIIIKLLHI